jgi:translation elongation factor EF-Ts
LRKKGSGRGLPTGKTDRVVEKIVTGKMEKFYEENCRYEAALFA